jgi:Zn-dependent peptidase ImmA (M78 family)
MSGSNWYEPRTERSKLFARGIIKKLKIERPDEILVELIAVNEGALVLETDLQGCDGRLIRNGARGVIEVRSSILEFGKKRFVVAHELGHFKLHTESNQSGFFLDKKMLYLYSKVYPEETEANVFASELLMPDAMFKPKCLHKSPSWDLIEDLCVEFQTTLTATALRYIEFCPHDIALIYIKDGELKWSRASEGFPCRIRDSIDPGSRVMDFIKGVPNPQRMEKTRPTAWLSSRNIDTLRFAREESRVSSHYNSALTLLWVEMGEDHEQHEKYYEDNPDLDGDHFTPDGRRRRW